MYDYLFLATYNYNTLESLLNNPDLSFMSDVNIDNGAIETLGNRGEIKRKAEQHGLKFIIYSVSGRIEIKGSLHKFFNSVTKGIEGNYDLFSFYNAVQAIKLLNTMYKIEPTETKVHNLETGLNFTLDNLMASDTLDYFIAFKNKSFNRMNISSSNGKGLDVYFSQYGIKVYDKGLQYNLTDEILRFEIKYIKMQKLDNVLSLSDLMNVNIWIRLSEKLRESLKEVIYTDKFASNDLTKPECNLLTFCENPRNWDKSDKKKRYKAKEQFVKLINSKGDYKFRDFFTAQFDIIIDRMLDKTGDFFTKLQNEEKGLFYPLSSREESPFSSFESLKVKYSFYFENNTERYCAITRLPLVYFDKRSKNMNPKTLMYLRDNCFEIFELLRLEFMQFFNGFTSKEPDEYTYIAKQIRNTLSNCKTYRIKASRFYKHSQTTMF